jgi:hypothetical protein
VQALTGNFLDPRMRRPGRHLKLQLAVFDIELTRPLLLRLERLEQLARPVLGGHHTQRANDDDQEKDHVETEHYSFSATRITALRARGLAAISAAVGLMALPTRRSFGFGN